MLSYAKDILSISSAVWAQCTNVTDRQTNRQTDRPRNGNIDPNRRKIASLMANSPKRYFTYLRRVQLPGHGVTDWRRWHERNFILSFISIYSPRRRRYPQYCSPMCSSPGLQPCNCNIRHRLRHITGPDIGSQRPASGPQNVCASTRWSSGNYAAALAVSEWWESAMATSFIDELRSEND